MPQYMILADFGRFGLAYVERDPVDATWDGTVRDLAAGEWNKPVKVVEFDVSAGTCRDVTERAFLAARLVRDFLFA